MSRNIEQIRADIATLSANERTSRALIIALAPEVVQRIHTHDDIDSANRFLVALSEANQKMVKMYYENFAGHSFGEGVLGKRRVDYTDKDGNKVTPFTNAVDAFNTHKESGLNIFQWAFQKKDIVEAPVDLAKAAKAWQGKAKKAIKQGAARPAVLQAALGDLFSIEEVLNILGELSKAQAATVSQ